jgi:multidrug resistance efflux pump
MSSSSIVPRPVALRWRDAMTRGGPIVVALVAIAAVSVLWRQEVFPTNFVGEAQSPASMVSASADGKLVDLEVKLFDVVEANQVLAKIQVASDQGMQLTLAALKSELEIMRIRLLQDQQRNDLNYVSTWSDLLQQRLELNEARILLRQAESEFERVRKLHEEQIIPTGVGTDQTGFELALRDRDALRARVADKESLVAELGAGLEKLRSGSGTNALTELQATIESAIEAQDAQLRAAESPEFLRAPIGGMIMNLNYRAGEYVREGDVVFEIRGTEPEWILGFIRQPIAFQPQPGDRVKVLSRGRPRRQAEAKVIRVGAHLQTFAQPLRVRGFDASQERGLPVLIEYPASLQLRAGELVDLVPIRE